MHISISIPHRTRFMTKARKIIFTHPTGNANCRATLEGLSEALLLAWFYTSVALFHRSIWSFFSRISMGCELKRRQYSDTLRNLTWQRSLRERGRIVATKAGHTSLTRNESGIFCINAVYRDLDRVVANRLNRVAVDGMYSYEDDSL